MFKWILVLLLLGLLSPWFALGGYGLYHGYHVTAGFRAVVEALLDKNLYPTGEQIIRADQLEVVRFPTSWNGDLESEALNEASGLAPSGTQKDTFFSINDSGNEPAVFAIGSHGEDLGSWPVVYPSHHDFEDIAGFELDGERYLLIADTGDNFYWRPKVTIIVIREPDFAQADRTPIQPAWRFDVHYPHGPRDVEAVAVDAASNSVFLISKRRVPAEVFRVPLNPQSGEATAKLVASLTGIPEPSARDKREDPDFGLFQSSPTSLDIQGLYAVVMTYRDAYLYERRRGQDWGEAFGGIPLRISLPHINGIESGSLDHQAKHLFVTGERPEGIGRMGFYEVSLKR